MSDGRPLEGRLALVTGASRGIGEASARVLSDAGARTVLLARSAERLRTLAGELGGSALPADVTDADGLHAALSEMLEREGVPDVVVHAAGVFDLVPVAETGRETLDRNLDVNLRGAFLVVRRLLPGMLDRGSGLIVSVGSVSGRKAFPGNAAYSASKYGLRGMHEVLLEEIRGTGVRATLLEPGAVDTAIWDPIGPDEREDLPPRAAMLDADAVARAVLFVATRPDDVQIPVLPIEAA